MVKESGCYPPAKVHPQTGRSVVRSHLGTFLFLFFLDIFHIYFSHLSLQIRHIVYFIFFNLKINLCTIFMHGYIVNIYQLTNLSTIHSLRESTTDPGIPCQCQMAGQHISSAAHSLRGHWHISGEARHPRRPSQPIPGSR